MADARRLADLSMVPPLAAEVAKQIAAGGPPLTSSAIDAVGGDPTARALASRVLSPEMFGTSADWATALELCVIAANGGPILFEKGKTYVFYRVANLTRDFNIDLNGAVIVAPLGFIVASTRNSYTAFTPFTTVGGSKTLPIPAGVPIAANRWISLESNTVRLATGTYLYGELIEVIDVAGGVANLREPLLDSYQVDTIRIQALERARVVNGKVDITGAAIQAPGGNPVVGIDVMARWVEINVNVVGGQYAGVGVAALGVFVYLKGTATGITNVQGFNAGAGRVGYGWLGTGSYIFASINAVNCKHGYSSADRTRLTKQVVLDVCSGSTPKGKHNDVATLADGHSEPLYQGILDVHANVLDVVVREPKLDGVNALMMLRGAKATITSPELRSRGCTSSYRQNFLIYVGEENTSKLTVSDVKVTADTDVDPLTAATPYLVGVHPDFQNTAYGDIQVTGVNATNVAVFDFEPTTSANQSLGNVLFRQVRGQIIRGIKIGATAPSVQILSVGDVVLDGDYSLLASSQYTLGPALSANFYNQIGNVTVSGNVDTTALPGGTAAAFVVGKTEALTSGAGTLKNIDNSQLKLKASGRGMEIGSTSATAPGLMNLTGIVEYNQANGTSASGIRLEFSTVTAKTARFRGAVVRNLGQSTANTPAVQFQNASSGDFSGITVNDLLAPQNQGTTPVGISLETITEVMWRASSPNIYYNNRGQLTADTIPTTGSFPVGTVVYPRAPAKSGPASWVYTTANGWVPTGIIPA